VTDDNYKSFIDENIKKERLVLFMKGIPEAPECGFSNRAAQALLSFGKPFHFVNVFDHEPAKFIPALAVFSDFPTLPQIWLDGELLGGSDIVADMLDSGELEKAYATT